MSNKTPAIISTLLDRFSYVLDPVLAKTPHDLITPELFASTNQAIAARYAVQCHVIEQHATETTQDKNHYIQAYEQEQTHLEAWLTQEQQPSYLASLILQQAKQRCTKLLTLYSGLNQLAQQYDIKALVINQEYMIHEASLLAWAKVNQVPVLHLCHGALIVNGTTFARHYEADYLTLAAESCADRLDDMRTGQGVRSLEGMISWDVYRSLDFSQLEALKTQLQIPDDALVVSFFTTFSITGAAISDPETYSKAMEAFFEAAAFVKQHARQEVFFIVKDRPSGEDFYRQRCWHQAKKLGLEQCFAYVFDRAEQIIVLSDITISLGSSIAIESMAMGKLAIDLNTRQTFLSGLCYGAEDGVLVTHAAGLPALLLKYVEDEPAREAWIEKGFNNQHYVGPTQDLMATQRSAALMLQVLGHPDAAQEVLNQDDFYDQFDINQQDARFYQENLYQSWLARHPMTELQGQLMGERFNQWSHHPRFHLLMVLEPAWLTAAANTLESLQHQIYPFYGVTILSTAPCPDAELNQIEHLQWITTSDPWAAVNQAVADVASDWVIHLWPGDELHPHALFHFADYANLHPEWLAMYGDEDLLIMQEEATQEASTSLHHRRESPLFKPDFNLDLFRSTDYLSRCAAIKIEAWQALDGVKAAYTWRQIEDLLFRLIERASGPSVGHLPFMLSHRFPLTEALLQTSDFEALGQHIRDEHLLRCGFARSECEVGLTPNTYFCRTGLPLAASTALALVSPNLDEPLAACLLSYAAHPATADLYLATPYSTEQVTAYLKALDLNFQPRLLMLDAWQGSALAWQQTMTALADYPAVVLCHPGVRFVQSDWLTPLLEGLARPDVAMVMPKLVASTGRIYSAGRILGKDNGMGDYLAGFFFDQDTEHLARVWCEQNFNLLNTECLAVKTAAWQAAGGLPAHLNTDWALAALQIQLRLQGQLLLMTPRATVAFVGGALDTHAARWADREAVLDQHFDLFVDDPAYHRHVSLRGSGLDPDTRLSAPWHPVYSQRPKILLITTWHPTLEKDEAYQALLNWLKLLAEQEVIVYQSLVVSELHQAPPPTSLEVARLQPHVCLYWGDSSSTASLEQELTRWTKIQQWRCIQQEKGQGQQAAGLYTVPNQTQLCALQALIEAATTQEAAQALWQQLAP